MTIVELEAFLTDYMAVCRKHDAYIERFGSGGFDGISVFDFEFGTRLQDLGAHIHNLRRDTDTDTTGE